MGRLLCRNGLGHSFGGTRRGGGGRGGGCSGGLEKPEVSALGWIGNQVFQVAFTKLHLALGGELSNDIWNHLEQHLVAEYGQRLQRKFTQHGGGKMLRNTRVDGGKKGYIVHLRRGGFRLSWEELLPSSEERPPVERLVH